MTTTSQPISRTCAECGHAETVDPSTYPTRCPECRTRYCPYCYVRGADIRWTPIGCTGTSYHVTVCRPCYDHQRAAERESLAADRKAVQS